MKKANVAAFILANIALVFISCSAFADGEVQAFTEAPAAATAPTATSKSEACAKPLVKEREDGRLFIDRATLAGIMANRGYTVNSKAQNNYSSNNGGPSLLEVLNSEVLGGAIANDKDALTYYFGSNASRYAGLWFVVGRFDPQARVRDYYVINLAIERSTQALVIVDARPAVQRTVQVYTSTISAFGRSDSAANNVETKFRIRPILGCSYLEIPQHIVEKLQGRHEITIVEALEALNSQRRTNPMPYLDRGLMVKDQYTLFGFTGDGRKVRIGLKREFVDKKPVWRLLTAFFKD